MLVTLIIVGLLMTPSILVIAAAMRSSQISRQEERRGLLRVRD